MAGLRALPPAQTAAASPTDIYNPAVMAPAAGVASTKFTVSVPTATIKRPASIAIAPINKPAIAIVNLSGSNCTTRTSGTTCWASVSAPVGNQMFVATAFSANNATGTKISAAVVNAIISSAAANTVTMTTSGAPASILVSLESNNPKAAATIRTDVIARDANGYTIVGPDAYASAITLTSSDPTDVSLKPTVITRPAWPSSILSYDGKPLAQPVVIGAQAAGVATSAVTPSQLMAAPHGSTAIASAQISSAVGGIIQLPDGTRLSVPAQALPVSSVVQLANVPSPQPGATIAPVQPLAPTIRVTFGLTQQASGTVQSAMSLALPQSYVQMLKRRAAARPRTAVTDIAIAIVNICTETDCYQSIGEPVQEGTDIAISFVSSLFTSQIKSIEVTLAGLATHGTALLQPGWRVWDPNATPTAATNYTHWVAESPPPKPFHPVLLLHGIASSIEGTFPDDMVKQIVANGDYDTVIGYDYNWGDTADRQASAIASAVSSLGYQHLDIVGHSMGTLVGMGVAANIAPTYVQNLVLIEGPLHGAMTTQGNQLLSSIGFITSITGSIVSPGSLISGLGLLNVNAGWAAQFAPTSTVITGIEGALRKRPPFRVIEAAGGTPLFSYEPTLFALLTGRTMPQPNDGIIETASELDTTDVRGLTGLPGGTPGGTVPVPAFSPESHVTLVDNLVDEGLVQTSIEFQIENSNGTYFSGAPTIVMKGSGAAGGICQANNTSGYTYTPDKSSIDTAVFSVQPALGTWQIEKPQGTACDLTWGFGFFLGTAPNVLRTPAPTQSPFFDQKDPKGNVTHIDTLQVWAIADCSEGSRTPPTPCAAAPGTQLPFVPPNPQASAAPALQQASGLQQIEIRRPLSRSVAYITDLV